MTPFGRDPVQIWPDDEYDWDGKDIFAVWIIGVPLLPNGKASRSRVRKGEAPGHYREMATARGQATAKKLRDLINLQIRGTA